MLQVFWPAVAIMKRLRFPYKFLLIGLLSLLAIGYLFVSYTQNLRATIDANRSELAGLEVVQPVTHLLRHLQQHRGLTSGVLGGEEKLREKIAGKVADLALSIEKVEAANAKYGSALKFTDEWRAIQSDWEKLKGDWPRLTVDENLQRHGALIKKALGVITLVSESSGLILDPDIDSYYLMIMATEHLPDLLERMGRLRAAGTGVLAKKEIDEAGKIKFSTPVGALQKVLDDVKHDLQRAALANPAIKGKLDDFSAKIDASAGDVLRIVREDILSARLETPADVYFGRATEAIDTGYSQLNDTIFPTLGQTIGQRVISQTRQFQFSVGLSVLTIVGFLYMAIGAYLAIIAGIAQLNAGAERIEGGDLTARVAYDGKDELQSVALRFNAMAAGFGQLISRIQRSADSVSKASESLASNAEQVARSSLQQADSASSMAAAVEELTVSVGEVKRHADEAHALSERSGEFAVQGSSVVGKTVREMDVIADSVTASSAVIEALGEQSGKISDIVNVIKEIADQTNLLALNAAIEAARAGESGRGFAVVADEVRKLAERTTKSTAEISTMVKTIQDGTTRAVSSMQDGVIRVRSGVALAQEAGASMQQIGTGAAQVVEVVGGISLALKEQTEAANEIAGNVERIAQAAEENNTAVGATARTAQELQVLAKTLHDEAHRFRVG